MDKQNIVINTVKHYSAIERNEVMMHATAWMNLENIILSERSQAQKTMDMIPFM